MAEVTPPQEPQSAAEYDDRTTAAVKSDFFALLPAGSTSR